MKRRDGTPQAQKGGRPPGRRNKRTEDIHQAFEAAAIKALGGSMGAAMRWLVRTLKSQAEDGSTPAIARLEERLLGKVPQPLQHSGPEGGPIIWEVEYVDDDAQIGPVKTPRRAGKTPAHPKKA